MRNLLFIILLVITACGQTHSNSSNQNQPKGQDSTVVNIDTLDTDAAIKFVTGQFDFKTHDNFVKIDPRFSDKEVYLQKKTYRAFRAMADSAAKDGITFTIVSGTRNFKVQKSIWDRKWNNSEASSDSAKAMEILEYSSMPMTSRHHWGTDIDLNNLNNSYFESGQGKREYDWLKAHAHSFGFYQPYSDKSLNDRTGYNEEKWHWSYMPLAGPYLAYYNANVTNEDITGFQGAELAAEIDMVKNYVNGVSVKVKQYNSQQ